MDEVLADKELESLKQYILAHPTERFWQALRNWSNYDAIFKQVRAGEGVRVIYEDMPIYIKDTFQD
jgi:hypothetical protein